jgi:hypothetical protein
LPQRGHIIRSRNPASGMLRPGVQPPIGPALAFHLSFLTEASVRIIADSPRLETRRRTAHNAIVPNTSPYSVNVIKDANRPGRYRWEVYETAKLRDSSMFSFATRREAQTDAELFIEKLVATWQRSNDKPPKPRDI